MKTFVSPNATRDDNNHTGETCPATLNAQCRRHINLEDGPVKVKTKRRFTSTEEIGSEWIELVNRK